MRLEVGSGISGWDRQDLDPTEIRETVVTLLSQQLA